MKKVLITLGLLASLPIATQAVTIDDLLRSKMVIDRATTPIYGPNYYTLNELHRSTGVELRDTTIVNNTYDYGITIPVDEQYLIVKNMFGLGYSFLFYISDSTGNRVDDGDYLCYDGTADAVEWLHRGRFHISKALEGDKGLQALDFLSVDGQSTNYYIGRNLNYIIG